MRQYATTARMQGQTIGFVPTMGALHAGHLALVSQAVAHNNIAVASVFVNPLQFNNADDFAKYPRQFDADLALLQETGCHVVFMPDAAGIYPAKPFTGFNFGALEVVMEGAHRPGHFSGVGVVVSKLLHLVQPHRAYFGQKDFQQLAIIKALVADLAFDVEIIPCATLREESGLAMSSRNQRLSKDERAVAAHIYKSLLAAVNVLQAGQTVEQARHAAMQVLMPFTSLRAEYFEVAHAHSLELLAGKPHGTVAVCIAVHLGPVRLIDNVVINIA